MKRLAFIAFTACAAVSLLLCCTLVVLWLAVPPSSGFRLEWGRVDMGRPSRSRFQIRVVGGQVEFSRRFFVVTAGPDSPTAEQYRQAFALEQWSLALAPRVERVGDVTRPVNTVGHWSFTTFPNNPTVTGSESYWAAADWLLAVVTAIPPAAWFLTRPGRGRSGDPVNEPSDVNRTVEVVKGEADMGGGQAAPEA